MKQDESERWNSDETCWIRMQSAMKQFVSWSWSTVKHVESRWTWSWNTLNQDETVGHETHCFMPMKYLEWGTVTTDISIFLYWFWFIVFHGVSLRWFMLFHCCFKLFHAVSLLFHCCFIAVSLLFHAVSLLFHCSFIAVLCCFKVFHCSVSFCFTVFHRPVSWCFKVFHYPVSSCFMTIKQVQWERAFRER